jgi:hypothetical protein
MTSTAQLNARTFENMFHVRLAAGKSELDGEAYLARPTSPSGLFKPPVSQQSSFNVLSTTDIVPTDI